MRECVNEGMRECVREMHEFGLVKGAQMSIVALKKKEERTLLFSVDVLNYLFRLPSHPVFKV